MSSLTQLAELENSISLPGKVLFTRAIVSHLGLRDSIPPEGAEQLQHWRERQGHASEGVTKHPEILSPSTREIHLIQELQSVKSPLQGRCLGVPLNLNWH